MQNAAEGRQSHLLVIEDNPADVELLRRALAIAGVDYRMTVVEDGAEAIALFRPGAGIALPDLVIVDLNLPKHGGFEIIERMRSNPEFAEMPVVILSSSSAPRDRSKMERFKVRRYIVKPADLEEFMGVGQQIRDLLAATRAQS
jgi:CheY-like chemotaxis protein